MPYGEKLMIIQAILLLSFLVTISTIIKKKVINLRNLFLIYWIIILLIYRYGPLKFNDVNEKTIKVIMLGCIAFWLGTWTSELLCNKVRFKCPKKDLEPNVQFLLILTIIHIVTSVYFGIRMLSFMQAGYSYSQVRSIYQGYISTNFMKSQFEQIISHWVALPLNLVLPLLAILIVTFNMTHKINRAFFGLIIFDEILYFLYTQSRFSFAYILIFGIVSLFKFRNNFSKKFFHRLVILLCMVIILILGMTLIRFSASEAMSGLVSITAYISGCIPLMDNLIKRADVNHYQTYGANFFYGIVTIFESIRGITPFGKSEFYLYMEKIQMEKELFIPIGKNIWFNAFSSVWYDFYLDFRMTGVAIYGFVFGWISQNVIARKINSSNMYDVAIGLMMCIAVFMSIIRWQFIMSSFCFSFVYIFLIFKLRVQFIYKKW